MVNRPILLLIEYVGPGTYHGIQMAQRKPLSGLHIFIPSKEAKVCKPYP